MTDDKGIEHVTDEVHVKAIWKGLLDDGTITNLNDESSASLVSGL